MFKYHTNMWAEILRSFIVQVERAIWDFKVARNIEVTFIHTDLVKWCKSLCNLYLYLCFVNRHGLLP